MSVNKTHDLIANCQFGYIYVDNNNEIKPKIFYSPLWNNKQKGREK
jgi:hypothetical protein